MATSSTLAGTRHPLRVVSCGARWALAIAGVLPMLACSPTLDWRDVSLGGDTRLPFPCKPDRLERRVPLLDRSVAARLWVCDAGGSTWSALAVELVEPDRSAEVLLALRRTIVANLNAGDGVAGSAVEDAKLPGMTPGLPAWRLRLQGTRPDGRPTAARVLIAAHGTQAYQLVVLDGGGAHAGRVEGAAEFLDGLRWAR